jgi:putative hydrolase of the HAD superfamily
MCNNLYKALIFDMGEVLVKTFDRNPRTKLAMQFNLSFEELEKLVYLSDSATQAMSGKISEVDHFNYVLKVLGSPKMSIEDFQKAFWNGDNIDHEIITFIHSIKNQYKLGLLSNAMDTTRQRLTDSYNLMGYFHESIFSYEVKMVKPNPEIFRIILGKLNITPKEAIFIDDMLENIEAANNLGIKTIHSMSTGKTIESIQILLGMKS